jgi:hypothetical protein
MAPSNSSTAVDPNPEFHGVTRKQGQLEPGRNTDRYWSINRRDRVHFEIPYPSNHHYRHSSQPLETFKPLQLRMSTNYRSPLTMASGCVDLSTIDGPSSRPVTRRDEMPYTRLNERPRTSYPAAQPLTYDPKNPWTWPKFKKPEREDKKRSLLEKPLTGSQLRSLHSIIKMGKLKKYENQAKRNLQKSAVSKETKSKHQSFKEDIAMENRSPKKDPWNFPRRLPQKDKNKITIVLPDKQLKASNDGDPTTVTNPFAMFERPRSHHVEKAEPTPKKNVTKKQKEKDIQKMQKILMQHQATERSHYDDYVAPGRATPLPAALQQPSPTANDKVVGWDMDPNSRPHSPASRLPTRRYTANSDVSGNGWNADESVRLEDHKSTPPLHHSDRTKTHSSESHDEKIAGSRNSKLRGDDKQRGSKDSQKRDERRTSSKDFQNRNERKISSQDPQNRGTKRSILVEKPGNGSHYSPVHVAVPAGSIMYADGEAVGGAERWEGAETLVKVSSRKSESHRSHSGVSKNRRNNLASNRDTWVELEPIPEDKLLVGSHASKTIQTRYGQNQKEEHSQPQSRKGHESQKQPSSKLAGSKASYQSPMVEEDPGNWKGWDKKSPSPEQANNFSLHTHSHKDVADWVGSVKVHSKTDNGSQKSGTRHKDQIAEWHAGKAPSDVSYGTGYGPRVESKKSSKHGSNSASDNGGRGWDASPVQSDSRKTSRKVSKKEDNWVTNDGKGTWCGSGKSVEGFF